jgi:hypothetical protein
LKTNERDLACIWISRPTEFTHLPPASEGIRKFRFVVFSPPVTYYSSLNLSRLSRCPNLIVAEELHLQQRAIARC